MVLGMSGRSGEPRRGNPQVKKEKSSSENVSQQTTQPTQKFKVGVMSMMSHDVIIYLLATISGTSSYSSYS